MNKLDSDKLPCVCVCMCDIRGKAVEFTTSRCYLSFDHGKVPEVVSGIHPNLWEACVHVSELFQVNDILYDLNDEHY